MIKNTGKQRKGQVCSSLSSQKPGVNEENAGDALTRTSAHTYTHSLSLSLDILPELAEGGDAHRLLDFDGDGCDKLLAVAARKDNVVVASVQLAVAVKIHEAKRSGVEGQADLGGLARVQVHTLEGKELLLWHGIILRECLDGGRVRPEETKDDFVACDLARVGDGDSVHGGLVQARVDDTHGRRRAPLLRKGCVGETWAESEGD